MAPVSFQDIEHAHNRIRGVAQLTPLQPFFGAAPKGNRLWVKAENLQRTGSFKFRGAYNAVASLSQGDRGHGVITYSSGNHGQAVAAAAHLLHIECVVVMPEDAIPLKVVLTKLWGAEVVFAGLTSLDRQKKALQLAASDGHCVIPPFDDARIIAGQGTAGVEIVEQLPDVEAVVVQVGGGGLISGVATAVKALRPEVAVIGVEPEGGADAKASLEKGSLVALDHIDTVADGLRTSQIGELNFQTIVELVDEIVTVSDEEILRTVGILANEAKLVVEPSGAVSTAAVLFGRLSMQNRRIATIASGGNIEPERLISCLELALRQQSPNTIPAA